MSITPVFSKNYVKFMSLICYLLLSQMLLKIHIVSLFNYIQITCMYLYVVFIAGVFTQTSNVHVYQNTTPADVYVKRIPMFLILLIASLFSVFEKVSPYL